MRVEARPNEQLARTRRKALKEAKLKIRVIAREGKSLKIILTKSHPFRKTTYGREICKVCKLCSNASCKFRCVLYEVKGKRCIVKRQNDGLYVGKTGQVSFYSCINLQLFRHFIVLHIIFELLHHISADFASSPENPSFLKFFLTSS